MVDGRVIVVGSINMDVVAQAQRLPGPGETIRGSAFATTPGGKGANQAVAARRSGGDVRMFGSLGTDVFGDTLLEFLRNEGIDVAGVSRCAGASGTALIMVGADGENAIVIVPGANDRVAADVLDDLDLTARDVVILQNETPEATNQQVIGAAKAAGARALLNLAPFREPTGSYLDELDYVIVNETEFALLTGQPAAAMSSGRVAGLLAEGAGPKVDIVVTVGAEGLHARLGESVVTIPGHHVEAVDTTGAGDCFCGAFGAALARGEAAADALQWASAAAALSVTKFGAGPSMPTRDQVRAFLDSDA